MSMEARTHLDQKGLEYLAGKIKAALEGKQPKGDYARVVDGKILSNVLPANVDDVLEFSGTVEQVSVAQQSLNVWEAVVFHKTEKRFYATNWEEVNASDITLPGQTQAKVLRVYENWKEREFYQDLVSNLPYAGKIYIDTESNRSYIWKDEKFSLVGSDLVLGHTSGTAYPGEEGTELERRIGTVESAIAGLKIPKLVTMTEADYAQLAEKDENTYYMLTEE